MDDSPDYRKILKEIGIQDEVKDIEIREAPLHGEHMASAIDYVTIKFNGSQDPLKLFVKKEIKINESIQKMYKEFGLFQKEALFYNTVLPKCREVVSRRTGDPNPLPFFMKCYYATDEITILENLADTEYKMVSKFDRQDLAHCKVILKLLAEYHASTYAYLNEFGRDKIRSAYPEITSNNMMKIMAQSIENSVQTSIDLIKSLDAEVENREKALEVLQNYKGKVGERLDFLSSSMRNDRIDVINHGDLWNNNVMFHDLDSGEINALLFDMQVLRIASPGLDLGYYLFTSVKDDVRRRHIDEILQTYYDELVHRLNALNEKFDVGFEEFKEDYKVKSELGFIVSLAFGIGVQVISEIDLSKAAEEDLLDYFMNTIKKWIERNPDKAKLGAMDLIQNIIEFCD